MAFRSPKDGHIFFTEIVERCLSLIEYGLWADLHASRLRSWLTNFTTDEEKYFAASVLDSLIYRSKDQTIALMQQLFQRGIPDLTRLQPTPLGVLDDPLTSLRRLYDPGFRLVTAVKSIDPPTKSPYLVARYMKQNLSIKERWIIQPQAIHDHISKGIRVFIFIDDFLGTGDQFSELLQTEGVAGPILKSAYIAYTPLVAHKRGCEYLSTHFPDLHVTAVENLDEAYGLFHPTSTQFDDGTNTPRDAKDFYYALLKKREIDLSGPKRRGYGHLELTYAFEHATPDNSLPILWWGESEKWRPLFAR